MISEAEIPVAGLAATPEVVILAAVTRVVVGVGISSVASPQNRVHENREIAEAAREAGAAICRSHTLSGWGFGTWPIWVNL